TEAVSAVINYAFEKIEVHRIYATHHIENTASGRVMEKSGMSFEGIMKDAQKNRDGSFSDLKLYAVINDRKG
ncbi:MAG TPA: N-acetyltransferase, partial [Erysipelotrichaceae bacterium]|nr:N-acetyltransferase [Erysipelotrichaceae bacterium]